MSNVLIGIIGVILFIGLALAGALFLGPRFQQSTNNSKASASVQAVSQVGNAANMANVQKRHDGQRGQHRRVAGHWFADGSADGRLPEVGADQSDGHGRDLAL